MKKNRNNKRKNIKNRMKKKRKKDKRETKTKWEDAKLLTCFELVVDTSCMYFVRMIYRQPMCPGLSPVDIACSM